VTFSCLNIWKLTRGLQLVESLTARSKFERLWPIEATKFANVLRSVRIPLVAQSECYRNFEASEHGLKSQVETRPTISNNLSFQLPEICKIGINDTSSSRSSQAGSFHLLVLQILKVSRKPLHATIHSVVAIIMLLFLDN
jgi:hypothetical protein